MSEGLKELLEEAQEYLKDADDEILEPYLIRRLADALSAQPAPGHTDLMVTPEAIDAFMEANPLPPGTPDDFSDLHPATASLVHRFAAALASKLRRAEQKYGYRDEWERDDWQDECRQHLAEHVQKGDPLDVAAYAAFCWKHGWSTTPPAPQPSADIERAWMSGFAHASSGWGPMERRDREIAERAAKMYAAERSAISSQTSPQGKQGVRTELARLGSQEATPNTGVKLEGGGG